MNNTNFKRFPLFIDISDKKIVVIGGGKVAVRRINTLLRFGADINVIAPEFDKESIIGDVTFIKRKFHQEDLEDAFMVIGATNDRYVNHFIYTICQDKNILCSIADCKEECNFYFPAVCLNNELSIGIVSDGNNHRLVRKTAEKIRRLTENA